MGNRKITTKTIKGKDKLHPGSRKAGQVTRANLRTVKLSSHNKQRREHADSKYVYVARHDARIDELTAERRPGRPKAREQIDLEELRRRDRAEYETGMEVPDLTHAPTVHLMYSWLESETNLLASHLDLLRHIRVAPEGEVLMTKPGRAGEMGITEVMAGGMAVDGDEELDAGKGEDWTTLNKSGVAGAAEAAEVTAAVIA